MKIKTENFVNYSIISFGLFPIIPNKLKGLLLIFIFLTSLYFFIKNIKRKYYLKPFLINSILLLAYLFSLTYTEDLIYASRKLGPGISIIIFPLIYSIFLGGFKIKRKVIEQMLNLFSLSTFIFMTIYFCFFLYSTEASIFSGLFRYDLNYMPFIGRHPIYISLFIGISIIYLSYKSLKFYKEKSKNKLINVIILMILIFSLFLVSSKNAILSLFVIAVIVGVFLLKSKLKILLSLIILSSTLILLIIYIPNINRRFNELFITKTYLFDKLDKDINSSQIRIAIWETSIENIKKAPILGYGIGDVQKVLNDSYQDISPMLLSEKYNSHNQYLGIWLSTGLIGLLLFFYFLSFNYKLAIDSKDYLFLAILIFFSLNFLTENILERQTGAMLFFFLINLFGFYNYKKLLRLKL